MRHFPFLDICHIHLRATKIMTLQIVPVNAPILCHILNSLTHCNAQIKKKFRTYRKRGSSILLVLAIIIRDAGYREHYSRRPPSQRRLCRHRCITTLSPDVTRNELGALPSQTSHRLKLSSPVLRFDSAWKSGLY